MLFHWFTQIRALSAAQDVAKMAAQTVERTQGGAGGDARSRQEGVSAAEAMSLARRLRTACAAMEVFCSRSREGGHVDSDTPSFLSSMTSYRRADALMVAVMAVSALFVRFWDAVFNAASYGLKPRRAPFFFLFFRGGHWRR